MEGLGYKHLEAHKKAHLKVIENYDSLIEDTERNGYGSRFINELTSIFVDDFIKADMSFKRHIQDIDFRK
jgi:hemerythrin